MDGDEPDGLSETRIILHPPNDGDCSAEEDNDEDNPAICNLPRELLLAASETNGSDELLDTGIPSSSSSTSRSGKKKMKWDIPSAQVTEEFEILEEKVVGFDDCQEPIDFFMKFWTEEVMQFILEQTNSYSPETNVSLNELYAVFGVLLASGVVSQSRRRDYWSSNNVKKNIAISLSIGQRRYESIFSKLHFCPTDAVPSNDKFMKVRMLVSKLNRLFLLHCPRGNCYSIDESMIPYFGRHGCKQFIRGKPVRFGYKIWMLATSSGYCVQLQPYPGLAEKASESYDFKSSGNVVYFFSEIIKKHFPDLRLSISMDNYFTSFKVLHALQNELGILATGTMRRNRIPSYPFDDKIIAKERGNIDKRYNEESGVHLVAWQDNKCVVIASTLCGAEPIANASRYSRSEKRRVDIKRPAVVKHYNKTMGGVDALDHNLAGCRTSLRGKNGIFQYLSIYWTYAVSMHG